MRIGIIFPTVYASGKVYKDRIFAPRDNLICLSNGLVKSGHKVLIFSATDFKTEAKVVSGNHDLVDRRTVIHKFRNIASPRREWLNVEFEKRNFELNITSKAFESFKKGEIDLLHCYHESSLFFTHYFQEISGINVLYSLHDPLPPSGSFEHFELSRFKHHSFIALSNQMKKSNLKLNFADTIYHGINVLSFPFEENPSDYLLFMGRLVPEKGLYDAIKTSIVLKTKLKIGTQLSSEVLKSFYYINKIKPIIKKPFIDNPKLFLGEEKRSVYKKALALLFPIHWDEVFGMVMIEAMACGTPVIAYNRGSVPEVVRDGVTGFVIEPEESKHDSKFIIKKKGVEGLIEAVKRIGEIDRRACRKHVEENFSIEKMVDSYERLYAKIIKEHE
jgi:glycosyltransferase involved in cell wall biosynthesis